MPNIDAAAIAAFLQVVIVLCGVVGTAYLLIDAAFTGFHVLAQVIGSGGSGSSGGSSSGGGMDAVYERAQAMAAAGVGQSEDFRHNTVTAAYDAGYSGRHLDGSADPATLAAWEQGSADRRQDRKASK